MAFFKSFKIIPQKIKLLFLELFHPKSYFTRNYVPYMILILGSFFFAGIVFISQIGVYSLEDKTASLSHSVERVRELTEIVNNTEASRYSTIAQLYHVNMRQIAEETASTVFVCDLSGKVIFYYDSRHPEVQKYDIDKTFIQQTLADGNHVELGDLYGFFDNLNYVYSSIAKDDTNNPQNIVCIGMPSNSIVDLIIDLLKIFLIILFVMFILILILSYFITSKITEPLKAIAIASKQFANGDFSLRVNENTNCIEIDDLSMSINEMARSLETSEKQRTTFIENVSHEIKTPMTSIGGFVDGILDGTIPYENQTHYLKIISSEVHRLSRLTVRMLQTSRINDENFTISIAPFNFTETISQIVIFFEKKIVAKNLDIEVFFPEEDIFVMGDRDNIHQVVYNLLDNAVKFTKPQNFLHITLNHTLTDAEFIISNKGDTIEHEKLVNLFDRFYKVDSSRSEDTTGAGLGLYLVKTIITLHKSDIKVTSVDGVTTFRFTLPLQKNNKTKNNY